MYVSPADRGKLGELGKLREAISVILLKQDRNRLVSRTLESRMRADGFSGWSDYRAFVQLCRDAGLHVYEGVGKQNHRAYFISIDPPPRREPDYFQRVGYVIEVGPSVWVNRSHPPSTTKFRASARVWATRGGVLGYCEKHGHPSKCIKSTKDRDDGPTLLARQS